MILLVQFRAEAAMWDCNNAHSADTYSLVETRAGSGLGLTTNTH